MTLSEATELITYPKFSHTNAQQWADLGCGDGLFSKALISLLPDSSIIHAVDKKSFKFNHPKIRYVKGDFDKDSLQLPPLDGIMMINSLHFIKDQFSLISRLKESLKPNGVFLLGEYDLTVGNQWVPYPLTIESAKNLFGKAGFDKFEKIGERQSLYNTGKIYSAYIYRSS